MTFSYKDIEINYSDLEQEQVDTLVSLLKTNYSFISDLLPKKISFTKDIKDCFFIADIKEYIREILTKLINNSSFEKLKNNKDFFNSIYYSILVSLYDDNGLFEKDLGEKEENYYFSLAAVSYYDDDEFIDFILNITDNKKEEVFNWLKDTCRLDVYNRLLGLFSNTMDVDNSLLKEVFIGNSLNILNNYTEITNGEEINYTKMSLDELDSLFQEYLLEVEPSGSWLFQYQNLKNNKQIVFIKTDNVESNNDSYVASDGTIYIYYNENIHDFKLLAHEFAHYLFEIPNVTISALSEFPAIYYEEQALNFLERKGYDSSELDGIKNIRKINSAILCVDSQELLDHIYTLQENGILTIEDLVKKYQSIESVLAIFGLDKKIESNGDLNSKVNDFIDANSIEIIALFELLMDRISYVIGNYLAQRLLQMDNGNSLMIKIQEDMSLISSSEVYNLICNNNYNKK